ncbi:MAG: MFS transporter [Actinomycetota bacterium]|nr:MFS transporter [Actinomycetota bacterium]
MSPTFSALGNRNYRLYAAGGIVSNTGTWMQRVAQDWLVLQLHHGSPAQAGTALGITTGLQFLPMLLFSAYAGVVADRVPKRRLLQYTQLSLGLVSLLLGVLGLTGVVTPWMVFVLVFAFGCGAAFDAPARQSFVSEIVSPDDLANAVGLNSASFNLARIVGPAVSGLMIGALGSGIFATGVVILVNAVSYAAVIYALSRMRESELAPFVPAGRGKGMLRDGVRYVRSRRDIMLILAVVFFAGTFGMNFQMTSALMATQIFHKGAGEYGILGTTLAIGSLTGALMGARRSARPRIKLVVLAALAFAVVEVVLGLAPSYLTFLLITPVLGFTVLTMINAANTSVQLSVVPAMRGRVMALYMMIFMGGTPLGAPVVGWVGGSFGARWTLIGGGVVTFVGVVAAVAVFLGARGPRRFGGRRTPPSTEETVDEVLAA